MPPKRESAELLTKEWLAKPLSRMIGTNDQRILQSFLLVGKNWISTDGASHCWPYAPRLRVPPIKVLFISSSESRYLLNSNFMGSGEKMTDPPTYYILIDGRFFRRLKARPCSSKSRSNSILLSISL